MHERDYQGNYKISTQDKLCLSSCIILMSVIIFADIYILFKFIL